jgi:hypothetical protein
MEEDIVIVGEFEDNFYAEIAQRELRAVGICANILKDDKNVVVSMLNKIRGVQLLVPNNQVEEAKKILEKKFV